MTAAAEPTTPTPPRRPTGTPTAGRANAIGHAFRLGIRQGFTEIRHTLRGAELWSYLSTPILVAVVFMFARDVELPGTGLTAVHYMLPGLLAASIALGGLMGPAGELTQQRDDGSLLRMKAIPHGLRGFVAGQTTKHILINLLQLSLVFAAGVAFAPSVFPTTLPTWAGLVGFVVLGLLAMLPVGTAIGAAIRSPVMMILPMLLTYGLLFISGIFGPMANQPQWLQWLGQSFPLYWLGLGLRSVLLPPEAVVVEIGESWRTLESVGMLGLWAVIGLVLAPLLVRRMIRGVSGSSMQAARERVLSKGY